MGPLEVRSDGAGWRDGPTSDRELHAAMARRRSCDAPRRRTKGKPFREAPTLDLAVGSNTRRALELLSTIRGRRREKCARCGRPAGGSESPRRLEEPREPLRETRRSTWPSAPTPVRANLGSPPPCARRPVSNLRADSSPRSPVPAGHAPKGSACTRHEPAGDPEPAA